jgi:hypothetical protein
MMAKVILVNPAMTTLGYSVITPRWLFVIAQATPAELVGDPLLVDEAIQEFEPGPVDAGDIASVLAIASLATRSWKRLNLVQRP